MADQALLFVFDPLCGWCYGAAPSMARLQAATSLPIELWPTGLFAAGNARPMTPAFRDYAWQNDQRIEQLTGQRFTQAYYDQVLSDYSVAFDSWPATLALHLIELAAPGQGLAALHRIQALRYVDGRDLSQPTVLADAAESFGLARADFLAAYADAEQHRALRARIDAGQRLMAGLHLRGVPALVSRDGERLAVLPSHLLFDEGDGLAAWLEGACTAR